jgi:DNA-binding CsgD family transcriptional regulator
VPNGVWDKPGPLDARERELAETHAEETSRILGRSVLLKGLAKLAASAHERLDGNGYPRHHEGSALGDGARLLAAADMYRALSEARPHRAAHSAADAAELLRAEAASGRLCPRAVQAVLTAASRAPSSRPEPTVASDARADDSARQDPTLSARELEILRLVARGLGNKEMARALFISPATVKRHLENIFDKIGVRTRAAVTVWALERGQL